MPVNLESRLPSRRTFLGLVPMGIAAGAAVSVAWPTSPARAEEIDTAKPGPLPDHFPQQDPALVRQVVGASHFNIKVVRELVEAQPALAKASYDWGFGDWETALGAASHTGRREIAELLLHHGARPNVFTFAMLGYLEAVKASIAAEQRLVNLPGPHSITLYAHARAGRDGAASVRTYLESLPNINKTAPMEALDESQHATYLGDYAFGPGEGEQLTVKVGGQGLLQVRKGANGVSRNLFYLGDHTFHPAGAEAVRIVFGVAGGTAQSIVVHDPDPVVSARRVE